MGETLWSEPFTGLDPDTPNKLVSPVISEISRFIWTIVMSVQTRSCCPTDPVPIVFSTDHPSIPQECGRASIGARAVLKKGPPNIRATS